MEDRPSFKKLSPEEIKAIVERVQRGEFEDFSPMTDEQRAERLANISPVIKHKYGEFVLPPYDPGYALSQMEGTDLTEENRAVIDRIMELARKKDTEDAEKKKRFDRIKSMFGL